MSSDEDTGVVRNFPIMMFAVVMGLTGLVIALEKAAFLFDLPDAPVEVGLWGVSATFVAFFVLYGLKVVRHPELVKAELHHPVKLNFFSTIPISLLLLSVAFHNAVNPILAIALWYVATPLQLAMLLYVLPRWLRHDYELHQLNPAWFIPIVGTILVPIVGVDAAPLFVSVFFLSVGLFFWLSLFALVLNRLVFHRALDERFVPTLFILLAPPAVGLIAYYRVVGEVDLFATMLYSLALFFLLFLLSMVSHFKMDRFYISWWAYTFPLDAFAIASLLMYEVTRQALFAALGVAGILLATGVIAWVGWATLGAARAHTLLKET